VVFQVQQRLWVQMAVLHRLLVGGTAGERG